MILNNLKGKVFAGDQPVSQIYHGTVPLWVDEVIDLNLPTQIAFIFDTTSSMQRYLAGFRALAEAIAQKSVELNGDDADIQFALVGYKDETDAKTPSLDFTNINNLQSNIPTVTSGGSDVLEDGYGAIVYACTQFSWDPTYNHSVFLFSGAGSHQRGASQASAISHLNSINAGFYFGTVNDSGYDAVASATGGFRFTSIDSFTSQIEAQQQAEE